MRRDSGADQGLDLVGRFAPSPTGPLHMGSLITALASYCDIKQRGGRWILRIDDIDPLRTDHRAIANITRTLHAHGLIPDAVPRQQSSFVTRYERALQQLLGLSFYCRCSRNELKDIKLYPGYCRAKKKKSSNCAVRIRVDNRRRSFADALKGDHDYVPSDEFGDFVIWRKDDLVTYHLATACDDAMDYSHILRGDDLFEMTAPQLFIMEKLGLSPPEYAHIPILTYADGTKLSKQTRAPALDTAIPEVNIRHALEFLGQNPPTNLMSVNEWIDWAVRQWRLEAVPSQLKPYIASDLA